jgi:hypothetical protein
MRVAAWAWASSENDTHEVIKSENYSRCVLKRRPGNFRGVYKNRHKVFPFFYDYYYF